MSLLDQEGYLNKLDDWNKKIAEQIADVEALNLTQEHWLVLNYLRQFYQDFPSIKYPTTRILIKELSNLLGQSKSNSLYFHQLFPKGLVQACKIAGLPKSSRCKNNVF